MITLRYYFDETVNFVLFSVSTKLLLTYITNFEIGDDTFLLSLYWFTSIDVFSYDNSFLPSQFKQV